MNGRIGKAMLSVPRKTNRRIRLALVTASPVPYKVELYRRLAAHPELDFTVIFMSDAGIRPADAGYGHRISWDTDLIEGYQSIFLRRSGANPNEANAPPFFAYRDFDIVGRLWKGRYDVVWLWGYNYLTHQLAALTQILRGGLILFGEDQTLLRPRPAWKVIVKKFGLPFLFRHGLALYVGSENYRWFQEYGVPAERLYYTPYAVDNDSFRRSAERLTPQKHRLRGEFGIRPDAGPVILMTARLIPEKQPLLLLEAFRRVQEKRRCTLLMVGSGVQEQAIRGEVRDKGIRDVVLAGFMNQREIAKAYAVADVFVLVSKSETWGLVVNEAMNFGLPIVVSDKVGSARDLVEDGVNGFIVSSNDPDELAGRLELLVDSAELRTEFGRASTGRIEKFCYEADIDGILMAITAGLRSRTRDIGVGAQSSQR
jgi:glycosyltransferase involved in cell wall biosynthesis